MTRTEQHLDDRVIIDAFQLRRMLRNNFKAQIPTIIWSPPGDGKNCIVNQFAQEEFEDALLCDVRLVHLDPTDIKGLPFVRDGVAHWARPIWLPDPKETRPVIMFWDELNRASSMNQSSALGAIQENRIGDYVFPAKTFHVAACNRMSDGGGLNKLIGAMTTRFSHAHYASTIQAWSYWATKNNINTMTVAFLRTRPELLSQFNPNAEVSPNPRAWEKVAKHTDLDLDHDLKLPSYAGDVGRAAAVEYMAYEELFQEIPDIDQIFRAPGTTRLPSNPSTCYAVVTALGRHMNDENIDSAMIYLDRLEREYATVAVRDALTKDESLKATHAYTKWCSQNMAALGR